MGILEKFFSPPNIEKLKEKGDIKGLIRALKHHDANVRRSAVKALGVLKDRRTQEPLIVALRDQNVDIRREAVRALAKSQGVREVQQIAENLNKSYRVLSHRADEGFVDVVGGPFSDHALASAGPGSQAVAALIRALNDGDPKVQTAASRALGRLMDPQVMKTLLYFLEDNLRSYDPRKYLLVDPQQTFPGGVRELIDTARAVKWGAVEDGRNPGRKGRKKQTA